MKGLEIRGISKFYGETTALEEISFQMETGEILSLLGPSGSGKTTLLEIIAGLQDPDAGICRWNGRDLQGIPTYQRGFGLMFQEFALFPHRNVAENVAFGLRMQEWTAARIQSRTAEVLDLVGLDGYEQRDVGTLSGGEQQRVGLARSLAPEPHLLMLDEPLGSLDRTLRERLMVELRQILKQTNQTAIYVTHDQEEAFAVADRVVVLNDGKVAQMGPPQEIYQQPKSVFIAQFLGLTNLFPGRAHPREMGSHLETRLGNWHIPAKHAGEVTVLIRPEKVSLEKPSPPDQKQSLDCTLEASLFRGQTIRLQVGCQGIPLKFDLPAYVAELPEANESLTLYFEPGEALQILPPENS